MCIMLTTILPPPPPEKCKCEEAAIVFSSSKAAQFKATAMPGTGQLGRTDYSRYKHKIDCILP